MDNTTNARPVSQGEEKFIIRRILTQLLNKWYLFVLFGSLGLLGSYILTRYSISGYSVNATIFVPLQPRGIEAGFEGLLPGDLIENQFEVYNQVEIIKSYYINEQVARNLNWRTSWYRKDELCWQNLVERKDMFHWIAYYKDEPFEVKEIPGMVNKSGLKLILEPLSDRQYRVSAEGETTLKGERRIVNFSSVGTYGEPFSNDFFHFILTPRVQPVPVEKRQYYFVFNNLLQVAATYRARLSVGLNDKESELIRLQLSGQQPEKEIDYLNELIAVYMREKVSYQTGTQRQSLEFIQEQLVNISDSLAAAGKSFTRFRAQNQVINLSKQGAQILRLLKETEWELNRNRWQLDYLRNLKQYMDQSNDLEQVTSPSVVGILDASFNKLIQEVSNLYSRQQVIAFSAREDNPALVMIEREIAQKRAILKENLDNLIENAAVLNRSLTEQLREQNSHLSSLPGKEQDLIDYQRRYELTNEIYTYLLHRRAEIDIALAGATSAVQVIDPACLNTTRPIGTSTPYRLMMGLLLGLAFPGIYILGITFFSYTIARQEDIENYTQLPILGNVNHNRTGSDTPVHDHPQSGIAEVYRQIRTNVQFMLPGEDQKIIAIHSINPGEGKSFTSVNMATILAMNNKKVILVGCDMRKPRVHKIFNIPNDHGLSTFLSRQDDQLDEMIVDSGIENLSLLPAGPHPPNPSELINQPLMEQLLKELASRYDYVILDNAPISHVTEGLIAGRHSDLNIFILRYGISKKEQVKYINQLAQDKLLRNVGLIINDITGPGFGYGYTNYYYQDYLSYGKGYYEEPAVSALGFKNWLMRKTRGSVG